MASSRASSCPSRHTALNCSSPKAWREGGGRLVVRLPLGRSQVDAEALPESLRGPEQPCGRPRLAREAKHRGEPLEAVPDHVPELELDQPAQRLAEERDRPLVLVLRKRCEALVDEGERHPLAVLERLEEPVGLLTQRRGLRIVAALERDPPEVADRERMASLLTGLAIEVGRAF